MSKGSPSITLADLNNALDPLIKAINYNRETSTSTNVQLSEIHQMVTSLSVKFDCIEQTVSQTSDELSKVVTKKATGRKPAAKKTSVIKKPAAKKTAKKDEDDDVEPAEEEEEPVPAEAEEEDEEEDEESKKPAKKAVVKKTTRKPVKKPAAPSRINKMNLFKTTYKNTPNVFDKYLTVKVKKQIEDTDKKHWEGLTGAPLENAHIMSYYNYIKNNHDNVLEDLKKKSLESTGASAGNEENQSDQDAQDD